MSTADSTSAVSDGYATTNTRDSAGDTAGDGWVTFAGTMLLMVRKRHAKHRASGAHAPAAARGRNPMTELTRMMARPQLVGSAGQSGRR